MSRSLDLTPRTCLRVLALTGALLGASAALGQQATFTQPDMAGQGAMGAHGRMDAQGGMSAHRTEGMDSYHAMGGHGGMDAQDGMSTHRTMDGDAGTDAQHAMAAHDGMDEHHGMASHDGMTADGHADPHRHHRLAPPSVLQRSVARYTVPSIELVRDDGTPVSLAAELDDGRPVILNFVYTTCTTVCPITSQTFAQVQGELGAQGAAVHLVSISIDPEQDTPARLRAYAHKFGAGPGWQHYTGSMAASIAAQRAFDVYRADKMSHIPVTLLRAAPDQSWVRIEGLASAREIEREFETLTQGTARKALAGRPGLTKPDA